jgi:hypothetical protein
MQYKLFLISVFFLGLGFSSYEARALSKDVHVVCSEKDASIYANEVLVGTGNAIVTVPGYKELLIRVEKKGYETYTIILYNKPRTPAPPKTLYVELLKKDESFELSVQTDLVNRDIEVSTLKSEDDAWKVISRIVTSYFDVLEVTDKETGYIRTAWSVENFSKSIVRTRVIIKLSSSNPLAYKIKIVSEYSDDPSVSIKDDQKFKNWDRCLRKYNDLIPEMQSRLK